MFARIGIMRVLNHPVERVFNDSMWKTYLPTPSVENGTDDVTYCDVGFSQWLLKTSGQNLI